MSMLAERRRKQKWSLNPRGKYWAEDTNKFGQKMLEKMGWSSGKGLGAKEDGITEHIKVSYKNDSKGMGFKETDDQWTEHESNFTQLLSSLSEVTEAPVISRESLESLEQKSQKSRARVHYHKFTRGKDLSRYSEKDLANIFGKKSLKDKKLPKVEDKSVEKDTDESDHKYGVQTHNGGSMLDYFKKKLPNYNKYIVNNDTASKDDNSESDCERPSFGFGFNSSNSQTKSAESDCERPSFGFGFKPSNNQTKSTFISYIQENQEETLGQQVDKIKKKKKSKETLSEVLEEETVGEDLISGKNLKRKSENELDCAFTPLKKKFKNFDNLNSLQDGEKITLTPIKKCKKKKSEKKAQIKSESENGLSNPAFDPFFKEVVVEKHSLEVIKEDDESLEEEIGKIVEGQVEELTKRDKKKGKKTSNLKMEHLDVIEEDDENSSQLEDAPRILSKKEKKKKNNIQEVDVNHLEQKKSKKDKKSKNIFEEGVENSAFNDSLLQQDPIEDTPSLKKKNKKKKIENGLTNPCFEDFVDSPEVTSGKKRKHKDVELEENIPENSETNENFHQESRKHTKKKGKDMCIKNNPKNLESNENFHQDSRKHKKKKANEDTCIENPAFNPDALVEDVQNTMYEVVRKKKKAKSGSSDKTPDGKSSKEKIEELEMPVMDEEVTLNTVVTPVIKAEDGKGAGKIKTFNNKLVSATRKKNGFLGITNEAFDDVGNKIEENIDSLSKELDDYQVEVENDMNEAKMEIMVGEMGDQSGENEILPNGDTKLKFKYANFGKAPPWLRKNDGSTSKTSYRHLIKGDIVLEFKNTNLHKIEGYARKQIMSN